MKLDIHCFSCLKLGSVQWKQDVDVAKSVVSLLRELGVSGQSVRKMVKEVSDEALKSSQWIWIRRSNSSWGPSRGST